MIVCELILYTNGNSRKAEICHLVNIWTSYWVLRNLQGWLKRVESNLWTGIEQKKINKRRRDGPPRAWNTTTYGFFTVSLDQQQLEQYTMTAKRKRLSDRIESESHHTKGLPSDNRFFSILEILHIERRCYFYFDTGTGSVYSRNYINTLVPVPYTVLPVLNWCVILY